jgi:serine protease inhibitor
VKSPSKNQISLVVVANQADIKNKYGSQVKEFFKALPFRWNFASGARKAINSVNRKVENTTRGAIKRFLNEGTTNTRPPVSNPIM